MAPLAPPAEKQRPPPQPRARLVGNPRRSCTRPFFRTVLRLARCFTLPLLTFACFFRDRGVPRVPFARC
eukprot:12919568-Prorocentrum_lima.AAC.1